MKLAAALATALAICSGQSADAATLTWTGSSGASSNVWDVGITPNWLSGGVPAVFNNGDAVVFDDTGTNILDLLCYSRKPMKMGGGAKMLSLLCS